MVSHSAREAARALSSASDVSQLADVTEYARQAVFQSSNLDESRTQVEVELTNAASIANRQDSSTASPLTLAAKRARVTVIYEAPIFLPFVNQYLPDIKLSSALSALAWG